MSFVIGQQISDVLPALINWYQQNIFLFSKVNPGAPSRDVTLWALQEAELILFN